MPDPGSSHGRSPSVPAPSFAPPSPPAPPPYAGAPYPPGGSYPPGPSGPYADPFGAPVLPAGGRRAAPQRSGSSRLLVGLVVVLVVLVLTGAANALRMQLQEPTERRLGSQMDLSSHSELAGYATFTGGHGRPVPATMPWGYECAPILLELDPRMPAAMAKQVRGVVETARHDGLNVAAVRAGSSPREGALTGDATSWFAVPVRYTTSPAPVNDVGKPQGLGGTYTTHLAFGDRYEVLRAWTFVVYGRTLGTDPVKARRTARLMVARATGLAGGADPGSGIARHLASTVDTFTGADLAAMHAMSGCPVPAKPIP